MSINDLSYTVIGKAYEVHRTLGPGLLETAYQRCLKYELEQEGLKVEIEKGLPLIYKEIKLEQGYRIDLIVEGKLVVEVKAVESLRPVHEAQVLTYLKLGKFPVGLLLNFNSKLMKEGIKRFKNFYLDGGW